MIEQYLDPQTISSIVALIIAVSFDGLWARGKGKLTEFRNLILSVDDAVKDDRVTEDEFVKIWDAAKKVFTSA